MLVVSFRSEAPLLLEVGRQQAVYPPSLAPLLQELHLRQVVRRTPVQQLVHRRFHGLVTHASPKGSTANMTTPCASSRISVPRAVSSNGLEIVPLWVELARSEARQLQEVAQVQQEARPQLVARRAWVEQIHLGVVLAPDARATSRKSKATRDSVWPKW